MFKDLINSFKSSTNKKEYVTKEAIEKQVEALKAYREEGLEILRNMEKNGDTVSRKITNHFSRVGISKHGDLLRKIADAGEDGTRACLSMYTNLGFSNPDFALTEQAIERLSGTKIEHYMVNGRRVFRASEQQAKAVAAAFLNLTAESLKTVFHHKAFPYASAQQMFEVLVASRIPYFMNIPDHNNQLVSVAVCFSNGSITSKPEEATWAANLTDEEYSKIKKDMKEKGQGSNFIVLDITENLPLDIQKL